VIEAMMMNAVEFRHRTHPLARFRCEITTARATACVPFVWGAASNLPFLPRIRYGRAVLRPASWNLSASDLLARRAAWPEWTQAWSASTWTGTATVTEAPDLHDYGWNGAHAHELVIPLTATQPPSAPLFARQAGPEQLRWLTGSSLCHGAAGPFQTAWHIAADAHAPNLTAQLAQSRRAAPDPRTP
jgi:class I lanthipeptide synthase